MLCPPSASSQRCGQCVDAVKPQQEHALVGSRPIIADFESAVLRSKQMSGVRSVVVGENLYQRRHRIAWLGAAVADLWLKRHDLEDLLVDGSLSLVSCTRVTEHMTDEVRMVGEPVRRLVHAGEFCSIANTRGTRTCRLWVGPGPAKVWKRSPVKTTDAANCGDVVVHVLNYSVKVAFLACAWFFVRRGRRFLIGHLSQIAHPPRLTCHRRISEHHKDGNSAVLRN